MLKTGQEPFTDHGTSIGVSVLDFWRFSYSELNSDPRNDIAEYLVALALGITEPYNKRDWTLYDIEYAGKRIEVKSTSYFQTYRTDGGVSMNRTFSIRESTAIGEAQTRRHSDVYAFCLLNGYTEEEADPLKLENWYFYIVPTAVINEKCGHNKTISLKRIENLGYPPVPFSELKEAIDAALMKKQTGGKRSMNSNHLSQIFDRYIARFNELNDSHNSEYYKWEIAARFRPMLDEALAAEDADLPSKLAAVVLLTSQTIDNRYEQSFYALTDYAKKDSTAVRNAIKALLRVDGGNLILRKQKFTEFLTFCDTMHQKYYPNSWRYRASIRLPMMITGFYDPDNYYLYKASQAQAYADCVEFYDDWGSGTNIDLEIYHRMCDELVAAIKECDELLEVNHQRYSFSKKPMHPDAGYHLLAFDIIFCSTVYNLFEGIHCGAKNAAEKKAYLTKQAEAKSVAAEQQEALEQAALLDKAEAFFTEKLSIGHSIIHKTFGHGRITAVPDQDTIEATFSEKEAPVQLMWRVCVVSGVISFKTAENASEYDAMVILIRRATMIRRNVTAVEKKLGEYAEYLQT